MADVSDPDQEGEQIPIAKGINLTHLLILLVPVLLFLAMSGMLHWLVTNNEVRPPTAKLSQIAIFEMSSRIYLLCISSLFIFVCVFCVAKTALDLWILHSRQSRTLLFLCIALLALVAMSYFVLALTGGRSSNLELLGIEWYKNATAIVGENTTWSFWHFDQLLNIFSFCVILTVPILIVGGIACLDDLSGVTPEQNWRFQQDRFQTNVFMSATVLVVGVLLVRTWASYPAFLAYGNQDALFKLAFLELTSSFTTYMGLVYSILLAAYAIPVAYFLSLKADRIAFRTAFKGRVRDALNLTRSQITIAVRKERKEAQLMISATEIVQTVIALMAPLLTGAISSIVGALD